MVSLLISVHYSVGLRQMFLGPMVVRYHHVDSQFLCALHFLHRGDPVIHGDDQPHPLMVQGFNGAHVHAVALPFPLGNVVEHIRPNRFQVGV